MVLLYLVLFVLKYNIFSIDYILLKSFLSASCTALAAVVLLFTMPPKFRAFVGTCFHASVDISDGLKPFLDDIGKPGDRERMERGTKAEKLAVCFEHIRLWHFLLNRAVNFSDGSSQDESKQLIAEQATD